MKIKIDEAGYENFSDFLGVTQFANGVSVDDVLPRQVNLLASVVRIVDAETGVQYGPGHDFEAVQNIEAVTEKVLHLGKALVDAKEIPKVAKVEDKKEVNRYTQAQLEDIADKDGIAGLRAIAEPMGIKATSVAKLIDEIIKAG